MKKLTILALVIIMVFGAFGFASAQNEQGKGWLGVLITDSDDGPTVIDVQPDSPAAVAGIEADDIIASVNGESVADVAALSDAIQAAEVGSTLTLEIIRDGETIELSVKITEQPKDTPQRGRRETLREAAIPFFGALLEKTDEGLQVRQLLDALGDAAADNPLLEGDIITSLNGESVADLDLRDILEIIVGSVETGNIQATVLRDGDELTLELSAPMLGNAFELTEEFFNNGDFSGFPNLGNNPLQGFRLEMSQGRPRLGIEFRVIDETFAANLGITQTSGALVLHVSDDSPAAEAGLQAGDIVIAVNETALDGDVNLRDLIQGLDGTITLTVIRAGETLEIEVTLPDRAERQEERQDRRDDRQDRRNDRQNNPDEPAPENTPDSDGDA